MPISVSHQNQSLQLSLDALSLTHFSQPSCAVPLSYREQLGTLHALYAHASPCDKRASRQGKEGQSALLSPYALLVEDNESLRHLLMTLLIEDYGLQVIACSSGEQALAHLTSIAYPPLVLIVDYHLAGTMNGIDLYDRLEARAGWSPLSAIMVSAHLPLMQVRERGIRHLPKPFDLVRLVQIVEELLSEK